MIVQPFNDESFEAARTGNLPALRARLDAGHDIDALLDLTNEDEDSVLCLGNHTVTLCFVAAANGHAHVVRFLGERGANVDTPWVDNISPIWAAADQGFAEVIDALVAHGAALDTHDAQPPYTTPLIATIESNFVGAARALLNGGASPHVPNATGTPLCIAAREGRDAIVAMLIQYGAAANQQDDHGNTPLLHASFRGRTGSVRLLMKRVPMAQFARRMARCRAQRRSGSSTPTC